MFKRFITDPRAWFLLLLNSSLIYYYLQNPAGFNTIVWIYWLQSVLIGIFTFIELLMVKHPDASSMNINHHPVDQQNMGCAAFFFLFHFGFFHLVYAIFLLVSYRIGTDAKLVMITAGIFIAESTIELIRRRSQINNQAKENVGKMFFVPYFRIIPMHLMILIPSFLGMGSSVVFLILKMLADIGMYLATSNYRRSPSAL